MEIIRKYYAPESPLYALLVEHSQQVTEKALRVAARVSHLDPDLKFIEEAGLLHDIGISQTRAPSIHCHGAKPYLCHGTLGRDLLEREGLFRHALVCERHTGTGITREDIEKNQLPLPFREMVPVSLEEKIICYADKFFSKDPKRAHAEKSPEEIVKGLARFGPGKVDAFNEWFRIFGP